MSVNLFIILKVGNFYGPGNLTSSAIISMRPSSLLTALASFEDPTTHLGFDDLLSTQNLPKAVILVIILITSKGYGLKSDGGRSNRAESKGHQTQDF